MITAKFEGKIHEEYGSLGWAMLGKPAMEPLTGMAIPHDILEHFPDDDGSVEAEFMALGASIFVRNEECYYSRKGNCHSAASNISSEFIQHYYYLINNEKSLQFSDPGKIKIPEEIESILDDIVEEGKKHLKSEIEEDYQQFFSLQNQIKLKGWFAKGYRKAVKRYKGYTPDDLCYMFMETETLVDKITEYAEEGQILTVKIDLKNRQVKAWADYPESEDY